MRVLEPYGRQIVPGLRQSLAGQAGALVLCDSFTPSSPAEPAHGMLVAQVAGQQGFQGKLVALKFEDELDPQQQQGLQQLGRHVQGWGEAQQPAVVRQELYESILSTRLNTLHTATQRLLAVAESGARNVALNLSLGSTPALCVSAVLDMCSQPETAEQAQEQLAKAFATENQEDVHAGLVHLALQTSGDERLIQAREQFAHAVRDLESNHNSVIVAAGNDGAIGKRLACTFPAEFIRSDLVTPETTVVGALENDAPAPYNGDPTSVTVFAPGSAYIAQLKQTIHGTSFASPRVAALMATLHGQFPDLDSAAIEARLS